jgi:hypothetical protein
MAFTASSPRRITPLLSRAPVFVPPTAAPPGRPPSSLPLLTRPAPPPPQIRRYVYCDVVRAADISPFVDITGVQVGGRQQAVLAHLGAAAAA